MDLPQYKGNSLVNLMSSIAHICHKRYSYPRLNALEDIDPANYDRVVHILIDGLGYDYLSEVGANSFLKSRLKAKLTSVFPTTTAAALTTIATGVSSGEHGITGWYMHLEGTPLNKPAVVLPYIERESNRSLIELGIFPDKVFPKERLFDDCSETLALLPVEYINSHFTSYMLNDTKSRYYNSVDDFLNQLEEVICGETKLYSYCYLPHFDEICHHEGTKSEKLRQLFFYLDQKLAEITAKKDSRTLIIINSDHGLIDNQPEHCLLLEKYPSIEETLSFPLCGEARVCYCLVKDSYKDKFKSIVKAELGAVCQVYSFEELVDLKLFGQNQDHPFLKERTGDFVIFMKEGYVLKDRLTPDKEVSFHLADHGGLSSKELYIPLIII